MKLKTTPSVSGLFVGPNQLSRVPPGALKEANNLISRYPGSVEPRNGLVRGDTQYGFYGPPDDRVLAIGEAFGKYYLSCSSAMNGLFSIVDEQNTTVSTGQAAYPPSQTERMKFQLFNGKLYYTTAVGVRVIDSAGATPRTTGIPPAFEPYIFPVSTVGGWLLNGNQVAYRVVYYRRVGNSYIYGAPSNSFLTLNQLGGGADATVTINSFIPSYGLKAGDVIAVYRSEMTTIGVPTSDEMFLVLEHTLTAGEITAGFVTLSDITPESYLDLRAEPLYTNPNTGLGIAGANYPPPQCRDFCIYNKTAFYANCRSYSRFTTQLIGVGSPDGLQNGDTITFDFSIGATAVLTATTGVPGLNQFALDTTAGATGVLNTSRNLVDRINQYAATNNLPIFASMAVNSENFPSAITFSTTGYPNGITGITFNSFTFATSRSTAWTVPSGSSVEVGGTNRVFESRPLEPDCVPEANEIIVGDDSTVIYRIFALREGVLVFTSDGVYTINTSVTPRSVTLLDPTVKILGADCATVYNDEVYLSTSKGFMAVSVTGARQIDSAITGLVTPVFSGALTSDTSIRWHATSNPTENYVVFWVCSESAQANSSPPDIAFCYSALSGAWTTWEIGAWSSYVPRAAATALSNAPGKIVVGASDSGHLRFDEGSYYDREWAITVSGFVNSNTFTVAVPSSLDGVSAGDVLYTGAGGTYLASIVLANAVTGQVVIDGTLPGAGARVIYKSYECRAVFVENDVGAPALMKQFSEALVHVDELEGGGNRLCSYTELSTTEVEQEPDFDGTYSGRANFRVVLPRENQRARALTLGYFTARATTFWRLLGNTVVYEDDDTFSAR